MAAVLACGPGAVVSHWHAAHHWGLLATSRPRIDVTAPGRGRRGPREIQLHAVRHLDPRDTTVHEGIPVTSIHRTLLDLAEVAWPAQSERAYAQAQRLRLFDQRALTDVCDRSPGRRGVKTVRMLMATFDPLVLDARSDLELDFLAFARGSGLPAPRVNVLVEGFLVDAVWAEAKLVIEVDSWEYHRDRSAFESDRARDRKLQLAGYRVIRITHRMLSKEPAAVANAIRSLLLIAHPSGTPA
jgi:Protein of unknown function (DUF559)